MGMKLDSRPKGAARIQPPTWQGTGPDPLHRLAPIAQALQPGLREEGREALVQPQGERPFHENRRQQDPPCAEARQETGSHEGKKPDQARRQEGAGQGQEGGVVAEDEGRSDDPRAQAKAEDPPRPAGDRSDGHRRQKGQDIEALGDILDRIVGAYSLADQTQQDLVACSGGCSLEKKDQRQDQGRRYEPLDEPRKPNFRNRPGGADRAPVEGQHEDQLQPRLFLQIAGAPGTPED